MGPEIHVSKINCTTSKYLTNYYAYTHTLAGIPNGQLDGHIPGHDAAGTQRCVRREGRCGPEGERGDPVSQRACLINGPGFSLTSLPLPLTLLLPYDICLIKCSSGPHDCCFKYITIISALLTTQLILRLRKRATGAKELLAALAQMSKSARTENLFLARALMGFKKDIGLERIMFSVAFLYP